MKINKEEKMKVLNDEITKLKDSLASFKYQGTVEIKDTNKSDKRYIYIRRRQFNKIISKYIGIYSKELYDLVYSQCKQSKQIIKQIRHKEHQLAKLGFSQEKLNNKILRNIDLARSRFTDLIYNQGVLEGITATYAQTQTILVNGIVKGVKTDEMLKIMNLKSAWDFVLDQDVIRSKSDFNLYSEIAKLVNDKLLYFPNQIRSTKTLITGCKNYIPPIPSEFDVKREIKKILNSRKSAIDKSIDLCLYCMKKQIFRDGNKRCAIIFANHYLISKGEGLLIIDSKNVEEFRELLID